MMRGFKAFNNDLTCRGFQYEVGQVYEMDEKPVCCKKGFHFCKNLADVYKFYDISDDTRICIVEALGEFVTDDKIKYCTNKIKIVEEITDRAIKHCNVNDTSAGYYNTGDYNTGDRNTGDYNTTNAKVRLFNHYTDFEFNSREIVRFREILNSIPVSCKYTQFIDDCNMTEKEKAEHPEYITIGGYLKVVEEKADVKKWWDELSENDKEFIKSLPHYDEKIFFECIGLEEE